MKKSNKLVFVFAFLLALIGAGALFIYLRGLEQVPQETVKMTTVVVAVTDITPRTQITAEMLKTVEVPDQGIMGNPVVDPQAIIGKFAKDSIYANATIASEAVVDAITDELTLKITGDKRAVTVNVNHLTGVNGLIKPGDFVDVVVVLPPMAENNRTRPEIAKLFIQNAEVLAVNKQLHRDGNAQPTTAEGGENVEVNMSYVTLAVSVMDVEMLVLAKEIGYVELALRPMDGDYVYVTEGSIWQELLLNDMYQMKDVLPEYEIISKKPLLVDPAAFSYEKYIYYVVSYGDTLRSISAKFYGTEENYALLQQVNRIDDENMILTGSGIKIPVLDERRDENGN